MSKTISMGSTPKIIIERIDGDLSLVGWDGEDVLIKGDDETMNATQNGDEVHISSDDDLSIRAPKGASIFIHNIGGDASVRGILGIVEVKEAGGDLSMRDVGAVSIDTLHADLSLRGAKGHLFIKSAHSDVSIREVEGNVTLESVADDLALRDVRGNVTANVGEDVVLYLNPQPGKNYTINAGEDILLVMPPKANATLTMSADEISIDWKGVKLEEDATSGVVVLGDGSATITLSAGSDIRVSNQSNAGESAEDFGNFAGVGLDWSGIGMDWAGMGDRISKQVERATRQAADAGRRAAEAARRASETRRRAEERVEGRMKGKVNVNVGVGRWNWDLSPKGAPVPPKPQATEEERLAILKMLQEKKITADDADKLLAALEGDS
jgi:hypothetical protein